MAESWLEQLMARRAEKKAFSGRPKQYKRFKKWKTKRKGQKLLREGFSRSRTAAGLAGEDV